MFTYYDDQKTFDRCINWSRGYKEKRKKKQRKEKRTKNGVPGKLPGDTMVVLVGQMGILSAHAWCGTSVKNTMEETIMKRIIYVNHAIL